MVHQSLQNILQIVGNGLALWALDPLLSLEVGGRVHLRLIEQLDALQLMEGGIMRGVNLVTTVHVSGAEEGLVPVPQMHALVGRGVRSEEGFVADVIRVGGGTAGMVGIDAEIVEALRGRDDGILGVEDLVIVGEGSEVFLNLGSDDADGVVGPGVKTTADEGGNMRGDIVVGMVAQVALGVGVVHLLGNTGHCKRRRRSCRRPRQRGERGPCQSGIEKHGRYADGQELHRLFL
mmetsp:Transcript_10641/g.29927  ORF Transcript_10641/g.29927 Transcript_10641/m.29927 type:complete len:234 (+) Transcript_10641:2148-2849(+)